MVGYASLSEAWGDSFQTKKKRKQKTATCPPLLKEDANQLGENAVLPTCEPVCSLYNGTMDNIMDTYLDAYPFDKFQRVTKDEFSMPNAENRGLVRDQSVPMESAYDESYNLVSDYDSSSPNPPKTVPGSPNQYYDYDQFYGDELKTMRTTAEFHNQEPACREQHGDPARSVLEEEQIVARSSSNNENHGNTGVYDLTAYVLSGIFMIFIMEQFIKVGLLLQRTAI
jgi:hypothetical protein